MSYYEYIESGLGWDEWAEEKGLLVDNTKKEGDS